MADPVNLVNPYGRVVSVPAEQVEQAMGEGYAPASDEQVHSAIVQEEYGGLGHTLGAAAVGVARGATLGLSDVAIAELGGDEARETLQAYKEVSPYASTLGEVAGGLAGLGKLSTGAKGSSLLARGAKTGWSALRAPSRGLTLAGEAVEGVLGRGLMGATGRAALEGAVYGAGTALSESAIYDEELTGEMLASEAASGGLLGGGLGLGLTVGGRAMGAAGRKMAELVRRPSEEGGEAVARGMFGEAASGIGKWFSDKYASAASWLTGADREAVASLTELGPRGAARRARALGAPQIQDELTERMAQDLDEILGGSADIHQILRDSGMKRGEVAKIIGPERVVDRLTEARTTAGTLRSRLDDMIGNQKVFAGRGSLQRLRAAVDDIAADFERGIAATDDAVEQSAHAMIAIDKMKRATGSYTKPFQKNAARSAQPAWIKSSRELDNVYHGMQQQLENSEVWGAAADAQRRINRAVSDKLSVGRQFHDGFTSKLGRDPVNPWLDKHVADRGKILSHVSQLTSPSKDIKHRALMEYLGGNADSLAAMRDVLELTPDQLKTIDRVLERTKSLHGGIEEATETVVLQNQAKALSASSREGGIMGGLIGGSIAGGGFLPLLLSPVLSPDRTWRQLAAVESAAARAEERIGGSVRRISAKAKPAALRASQAVFEDDELEARRRAIAAADGDSAKRSMTTALGDVQLAPNATKYASETAARAVERARAILPREEPTHLFAAKPRASAFEAHALTERLTAIDEPEEAVEKVIDGDLSAAAVDSLREVFPRTYAELETQIIDKLSTAASQGRFPDYSERVRLSLALNKPLDPTMDPELIALVQAGYDEAEEQSAPPPRRSREVKLSGGHQTQAQRAGGAGEEAM